MPRNCHGTSRIATRSVARPRLASATDVCAEDLCEHLSGRVAKWWIPDEFAFIDEVPKTSVGKFDKKVLRKQLEEGALEGREVVKREAKEPA